MWLDVQSFGQASTFSRELCEVFVLQTESHKCMSLSVSMMAGCQVGVETQKYKAAL